MRRWAAGDRTAFEEIVRAWEKPVGRFLIRLTRNPELAGDLTREVFLRVYLKGASYTHGGTFKTWLYQIALNLARDAARKSARTPVLPLLPTAHPAAEELQRAQEHISQLQQALEQRVREARQTGLREGEAAARQKAAAEIEAIREQTSRTVAELSQVRSQLFHQAEGDLLRLAMEIARRIVHRELRVEPGAVDALIRHALDKVQGQEVCRVRAHPDQAAWLRPALERLGHVRGAFALPFPNLDRGHVQRRCAGLAHHSAPTSGPLRTAV